MAILDGGIVMTFQRLILVSSVLSLCLVAQPIISQEKQPPLKIPSKKEVMAAKLKEAQLILEGLALSDFKKVKTHADELLRTAEAAEFLNAHQDREYHLQMLLFKRAVSNISEKAKDKNIDGVMLGYSEMTMSCLKCHQLTRNLQ